MIKLFFLLTISLLVESCSTSNVFNSTKEKTETNILTPKEAIYQNNCVIIRDNWGVPHIYGKSDADAAYGLAYAQAEDDFFTVQETLLKARGKYSSVYGPGKNRINGILDYMVGLLKIWQIVEDNYEKLDPKTIQLCVW